MARAATSPELALFRTSGQRSKLRAAILAPTTIYTARINQTFSTWDQVLEITYDTGSGTLADIKADMTLLIGSSAGAHDIGICRIKSADATKFYIGETSNVRFANDQYLTVLRDWSLWGKHVKLTSGVPYMDGTIAYSDQHTNFDPVPIMGGHRVLKLTGASISADFDCSASYVYGSTISARSWSAPSSSSSSGMTTNTPTITWNATGWYPVYLTLTAANGKTFLGVRWVYVWSEASPPPQASIGECRQDAESGGWQFQITLYDNVTLADVRDRALVILFSEDWYGATQQSIGPLTGCENIRAVGWIGGEESINWNPEAGRVEFTCYGPHYWFGKVPGFPDGVEFTPYAPTAWTQMQNLTVDRGLWHFLHWRTTATRIMDVVLTSDTKYTREVSSLAGNLWEQLREMAFLQIFARAGCNRYGQLYIEVHPQLVPVASRTWPTVMTITKEDWEGEISFDRVTVPPCSLVHLSGVAVDAGGNGVPYFSLSPGHAYPQYGQPEILDNLLVSSQSQSNSLAGLYRSWQNNPYPNISISLAANNPLIDCFPRQKCAIAIAAGDTPRGITYSGNLIPASVADVFDPQKGNLHVEVSFEAETDEDISVNGDAPGATGSGTIPVPGDISFPPLPDYIPIFPGDVSATDGPSVVLLMDDGNGILRTEDFNASPVVWQFWNTGIATADLPYITDWLRTPNGAVYVAILEKGSVRWIDTIYRAPAIGGAFVKVIDQTWINANLSGGGIYGIGYNPLQAEQVALIGGLSSNSRFCLGADTSWVLKASFNPDTNFIGRLTFGANKWIWDKNKASAEYWLRFNADGSTLEATTVNFGQGHLYRHVRAGTSASIFKSYGLTSDLVTSIDNAANITGIEVAAGLGNIAVAPDGLYLMGNWDLATGNRGRSSDGGTTWAGLPNLIFGGAYTFAYAGGSGVNSRWIAARGTVQYSKNFGDAWTAKTGNLSSLIPVGMSLVGILVPGF